MHQRASNAVAPGTFVNAQKGDETVLVERVLENDEPEDVVTALIHTAFTAADACGDERRTSWIGRCDGIACDYSVEIEFRRAADRHVAIDHDAWSTA